MKRKLSLLLAMVLAMTMVMGMNLTALAAVLPRPDVCPERVTPCTHSEVDHDWNLVYVYEIAAEGAVKVAEYDWQDGSYIDCSRYDVSLFGDDPTPGKVYHKKSGGKYYFCQPTPAPTPKKESEQKVETVIVDRDTFKSDMPAKTVIVADSLEAKTFFDMKVHAADERTTTNQKLLASSLVRADANILLTQNIYPRRDLSTTENGALRVLTWNNLSKNQAGPVYAVVYNQIDGAYVINGILDANGTATFAGFKLRPASTITICK